MAREFVLVVTLPGTAERFTRTCSGRVTIGRSESADVRLSHPLVSREHASIEATDDGSIVIRDLASRNGTVVDGQPLHDQETHVTGETTFQIGPYVIAASSALTAGDETMQADNRISARRTSLDRMTRVLLADGRTAIEAVKGKEYELLDALDRAAPALVQNTPLGNAIWGPPIGGLAEQWDSSMLHNLVRRVRRKLEDHGLPADELVVSVPGVGYRLA